MAWFKLANEWWFMLFSKYLLTNKPGSRQQWLSKSSFKTEMQIKSFIASVVENCTTLFFPDDPCNLQPNWLFEVRFWIFKTTNVLNTFNFIFWTYFILNLLTCKRTFIYRMSSLLLREIVPTENKLKTDCKNDKWTKEI